MCGCKWRKWGSTGRKLQIMLLNLNQLPNCRALRLKCKFTLSAAVPNLKSQPNCLRHFSSEGHISQRHQSGVSMLSQCVKDPFMWSLKSTLRQDSMRMADKCTFLFHRNCYRSYLRRVSIWALSILASFIRVAGPGTRKFPVHQSILVNIQFGLWGLRGLSQRLSKDTAETQLMNDSANSAKSG